MIIAFQIEVSSLTNPFGVLKILQGTFTILFYYSLIWYHAAFGVLKAFSILDQKHIYE